MHGATRRVNGSKARRVDRLDRRSQRTDKSQTNILTMSIIIKEKIFASYKMSEYHFYFCCVKSAATCSKLDIYFLQLDQHDFGDHQCILMPDKYNLPVGIALVRSIEFYSSHLRLI